MQSEPCAPDGASHGTRPDQRLALILSLFALHRVAIPEPHILHQLVAEVRQAEGWDGDDPASPAALSPQTVTLCATVVRRFIAVEA